MHSFWKDIVRIQKTLLPCILNTQCLITQQIKYTSDAQYPKQGFIKVRDWSGLLNQIKYVNRDILFFWSVSMLTNKHHQSDKSLTRTTCSVICLKSISESILCVGWKCRVDVTAGAQLCIAVIFIHVTTSINCIHMQLFPLTDYVLHIAKFPFDNISGNVVVRCQSHSESTTQLQFTDTEINITF